MPKARFLICLVICAVLLTPVQSWAFQHVVIADFSLGVDENGVLSGWEPTESHGKANFSIIRDLGIYALRLRSDDSSFALQKPVNVNPDQYPVLSWKWKVIELPEGGDFRRSASLKSLKRQR